MNEWKTKTVGEIADTQLGKMLNKGRQSGKYAKPYLRTDNVHWGRFDLSEIKEMDIFPEEQDKYLATKGDLLMCEGGASGRTAIWDEDYDISFQNHVHRIRPRDPKKITPKYLLYYFEWFIKNGYASDLIKGVTISSLSQSGLRSIEVTYPPIDEQHKIVEILEDHLSRLDAALADVKQAKLKAAQFRRSLLQAAFTGNLNSDGTHLMTEYTNGPELKRLSDCLEKLKSGKRAERGWSPQCLSNPSPDENVWGVLKTTAVQMGKYEPEHNKQLPESLEPKVGLEVKPGDFLVTTTGPRNRCGIVCHVRETRKKLIFSGKILRFRAEETVILSNWLMYLLMSPDYQATLNEMKVGTSDSSVSIGNQQILDLQIPVPSIPEQQNIVSLLEDHLARLDDSVAIADEMEKQSASLRRSLLQAAFTGQLTKEVASV